MERYGPVLFRNADLTGANLTGANLSQGDFRRAKLHQTRLVRTNFVDSNLFEASGLDTCIHEGPSFISHRTLEISGMIAVEFLRGVGLPNLLIDYLPSLLQNGFNFYSCFISYSSRDQEFAERLHADLQRSGVRCWFAPHDLPIGAKTWDGIDEAIRTRDKVLLILSRDAIASDWVEDEVNTAFAEERRRSTLVLCPVLLDDAVAETTEAWARRLRDSRNIGDFSCWREQNAYRKVFEQLLRSLTRDE